MTFIPDFLELNDLQLSQIVEEMEDDFHLSQAVADVDDGMINSVVTNIVKDEDHFEDFRISQAASIAEGTCKMQNETRNEIYRNETKPNQTKRNSPKRNEIYRKETKRNNSKWNKTYFNEIISWGNTRQKLNEKNRESII